MIAIDTSSFRRYLSGEMGEDVELVESALQTMSAVLPPLVVTELLSEPTLEKATRRAIAGVPLLPLTDGYWERAGELRAEILRNRKKARVGDVLIAQVCIDANTPLITYDGDFRHFGSAGLIVLA